VDLVIIAARNNKMMLHNAHKFVITKQNKQPDFIMIQVFLFLLLSSLPGIFASSCLAQLEPSNYEVIPKDNTGSELIGGCGGSPFYAHSVGSAVQQLKVWIGGADGGLRAIYLQMFNGQKYTIGTMPTGGPAASITFSPGEIISGPITICGNGVGTRTGYLHFKTNKNQDFEVGTAHTEYIFDSGDSVLTGFWGQSGDDIGALGIYLMKQIESSTLTNVSYPNLSSITQDVAPNVMHLHFNNTSGVIQVIKKQITKQAGYTHSWALSGTSLTSSFSVFQRLGMYQNP